MGKQFQRIEPAHRDFIERQHIFFNASAAPEGRVNVSPRDSTALRILDPNTVIYLDRTGSGNETAAHLLLNDRLTMMFCAFDGSPMILRLYGHARIIPRHCLEYDTLLVAHFDNTDANPRNPNHPPKFVKWGEGTTDEMCIEIGRAHV